MSSISQRLAHLAERFALADVYAFGSRATEASAKVRGEVRTEVTAESDVDIAVRPRRGSTLSARDRVELTAALEMLFNVARVDLVVLPEAGAFLAVNAIRGELLYCQDRDEQAEYELYVLRRAGDLAHFERERQDLILEGGR